LEWNESETLRHGSVSIIDVVTRMSIDVHALWEVHREARWPPMSTPREGELMTLDTVVSGCALYFFDAEGTLDPPRIDLLQTCLMELDDLLPDLSGESIDYFGRLRTLAELLLSLQNPDA
jgi:hypothetical protein